MKRTATLLFSILMIALTAIFASNGLLSNVFAQPAAAQNKAVVVLKCFGLGFAPLPGVVQVISASSSADAPTITSAANCAQALADVLNTHGFSMQAVTSDGNGGVYYTLIR